MNQSFLRSVLFAILLCNIVSTLCHYTDNAIFVNQYPEPAWVTAAGILIVWLIMTPFSFLGYWLYIQKRFWAAYLCLGFYAVTGLSSPLHYLFPTAASMSVKMHVLIATDAISGLLLLGFITASISSQEWRNRVLERF